MPAKPIRIPLSSLVVLAADPPWKFRDGLPGKKRGAAKHYTCLSLDELKAHPLPPQVMRAPNAVLFLWRVAAMQLEALELGYAWGFEQHSELVWQKRTKKGKKHFGMGRITRQSHETCLVMVRGDHAPAVRNIRSTFDAPVGAHSEKPDRFYRIVEALYPNAHRYELFARRPRVGWAQYGQEFGKFAPEQLELQGGKDGYAKGNGGGTAKLRAVS